MEGVPWMESLLDSAEGAAALTPDEVPTEKLDSDIEADWCFVSLYGTVENEHITEQEDIKQVTHNVATCISKELLCNSEDELLAETVDEIFKTFEEVAEVDTSPLILFWTAWRRHEYDRHQQLHMKRSSISTLSSVTSEHINNDIIIALMVDLLRVSPDPEKIHLLWLKILTHFILESGSSRESIEILLKLKVAATVLGTMSAYRRSAEIQKYGCSALAVFAPVSPTPGRKAPLRESAIQVLTESLANHCENVDVVKDACAIIATVAEVMVHLPSYCLQQGFSAQETADLCQSAEDILECIRVAVMNRLEGISSHHSGAEEIQRSVNKLLACFGCLSVDQRPSEPEASFRPKSHTTPETLKQVSFSSELEVISDSPPSCTLSLTRGEVYHQLKLELDNQNGCESSNSSDRSLNQEQTSTDDPDMAYYDQVPVEMPDFNGNINLNDVTIKDAVSDYGEQSLNVPMYYGDPLLEHEEYEDPPLEYEDPPLEYHEPPLEYRGLSAEYEKPSSEYDDQLSDYEEPPSVCGDPSAEYEDPPLEYHKPMAECPFPAVCDEQLILAAGRKPFNKGRDTCEMRLSEDQEITLQSQPASPDEEPECYHEHVLGDKQIDRRKIVDQFPDNFWKEDTFKQEQDDREQSSLPDYEQIPALGQSGKFNCEEYAEQNSGINEQWLHEEEGDSRYYENVEMMHAQGEFSFTNIQQSPPREQISDNCLFDDEACYENVQEIKESMNHLNNLQGMRDGSAASNLRHNEYTERSERYSVDSNNLSGSLDHDLAEDIENHLPVPQEKRVVVDEESEHESVTILDNQHDELQQFEEEQDKVNDDRWDSTEHGHLLGGEVDTVGRSLFGPLQDFYEQQALLNENIQLLSQSHCSSDNVDDEVSGWSHDHDRSYDNQQNVETASGGQFVAEQEFPQQWKGVEYIEEDDHSESCDESGYSETNSCVRLLEENLQYLPQDTAVIETCEEDDHGNFRTEVGQETLEEQSNEDDNDWQSASGTETTAENEKSGMSDPQELCSATNGVDSIKCQDSDVAAMSNHTMASSAPDTVATDREALSNHEADTGESPSRKRSSSEVSLESELSLQDILDRVATEELCRQEVEQRLEEEYRVHSEYDILEALTSAGLLAEVDPRCETPKFPLDNMNADYDQYEGKSLNSGAGYSVSVEDAVSSSQIMRVPSEYENVERVTVKVVNVDDGWKERQQHKQTSFDSGLDDQYEPPGECASIREELVPRGMRQWGSCRRSERRFVDECVRMSRLSILTEDIDSAMWHENEAFNSTVITKTNLKLGNKYSEQEGLNVSGSSLDSTSLGDNSPSDPEGVSYQADRSRTESSTSGRNSTNSSGSFSNIQHHGFLGECRSMGSLDKLCNPRDASGDHCSPRIGHNRIKTLKTMSCSNMGSVTPPPKPRRTWYYQSSLDVRRSLRRSMQPSFNNPVYDNVPQLYASVLKPKRYHRNEPTYAKVQKKYLRPSSSDMGNGSLGILKSGTSSSVDSGVELLNKRRMKAKSRASSHLYEDVRMLGTKLRGGSTRSEMLSRYLEEDSSEATYEVCNLWVNSKCTNALDTFNHLTQRLVSLYSIVPEVRKEENRRSALLEEPPHLQDEYPAWANILSVLALEEGKWTLNLMAKFLPIADRLFQVDDKSVLNAVIEVIKVLVGRYGAEIRKNRNPSLFKTRFRVDCRECFTWLSKLHLRTEFLLTKRRQGESPGCLLHSSLLDSFAESLQPFSNPKT